MRKISKLIIISITTVFIFMACSRIHTDNPNIGEITVSTQSTPVTTSYQVPEMVYEEVEAITLTLAGECYDDKLSDKRKVTEVILNRVSSEKFGNTVLEVVSAKGQFVGYWKQSRPISESDIQIAEEVLTNWYKNNCEALSEYLFFYSGPNRENIFRSDY
ncbi:MAG: cell wall hydrolase [Bacteroidales bacterium]|nr:cell wall hydrolase [Bacteroidales bacterium]